MTHEYISSSIAILLFILVCHLTFQPNQILASVLPSFFSRPGAQFIVPDSPAFWGDSVLWFKKANLSVHYGHPNHIFHTARCKFIVADSQKFGGWQPSLLVFHCFRIFATSTNSTCGLTVEIMTQQQCLFEFRSSSYNSAKLIGLLNYY